MSHNNDYDYGNSCVVHFSLHINWPEGLYWIVYVYDHLKDMYI